MFLRLDGFTKEERIQMTARVNEAINQAGAWITDFHQYSNVLICINFEVLSANLEKLASTLQETGLHLSQESIEQLVSPNDSTLKKKELIGTSCTIIVKPEYPPRLGIPRLIYKVR